jgi:hypothetical protein
LKGSSRTLEEVLVDDAPILFRNDHAKQVGLLRRKLKVRYCHPNGKWPIQPTAPRKTGVHGFWRTIGEELATYVADFEDGLGGLLTLTTMNRIYRKVCAVAGSLQLFGGNGQPQYLGNGVEGM